MLVSKQCSVCKRFFTVPYDSYYFCDEHEHIVCAQCFERGHTTCNVCDTSLNHHDGEKVSQWALENGVLF